MSGGSLQWWAERVLGVVEETGTHAVRIRLAAEGQQWEVWDVTPGLTAEEWTKQAETLLSALAEEFPVKRVSLVFTAEDNNGTVFSQFPKSVHGKNKNAAELGANGGAKALSDALSSVALTMDKVLEMSRRMHDTQQKVIEDRDDEIRQLHELLRAIRTVELETEEQGNKVGEVMLDQLKELSPLAKMFVEHWLEQEKKKVPAVVVAAATTNGVKAS